MSLSASAWSSNCRRPTTSLEQQVAERTAELARANTQLRQEIDQHRQAEQTIRHQAALIDIATDAIYVQDADHCITFWSQGATQTLRLD